MTNQKDKGFSLIELFIVLVILGAISAVAVPSFIAYSDNANLKEAARDLSSDISYWRQRTVSDSVVYRIKFHVSTNNYTIQQETATNSGIFNDLSTKSIAGGSTAVTMDAATNITYVTFNTRGTSSGGTIVLTHNRRLSTATITVNTMGRVRVQYALK